MTLILIASIVGLAMGWVSGGSLTNLADKSIRLGVALPVLVVVQATIPALIGAGSSVGREVLIYYVWVPLAVAAAAVAAINLRLRGMFMISLGILLNVIVVGVNAGMPVAVANLSPTLRHGAEALVARSWLHVVMTSATRLPVLADVIPVPGPPGLRGMASLGDLFLCLGFAVCLQSLMNRPSHTSG